MKKLILSATLIVGYSFGFGSAAVAQTQYGQPTRYDQCQQRAQQISGYYGDVPDRYLDGGALRSAAKRANTVGAIAWLAGGNKKEIRRARKKAAKRGALEGAIKRAIAKDKQRKKRERYQFEIQTCMSGGR
ncbi:MAG: hypothetical protein COA69_02975 [Robiginitomaculum sp.]|nr:MAG: hypothetical protein COA69_02975 [Robiginitomaculum sp.]